MGKKKVTLTCCQGWGCHEHCILETHTVDGKIVRTQKSQLPGGIQPGNQICQKGATAWQIPYNEQRLLHPLKRVGERGESKFERISWDQALSEITEKINELTEKYGTRSIIVNPFQCGYPPYTSSVGYALVQRFINAYGASAVESMAVDFAVIFSDPVDIGMMSAPGRDALVEADNYVLIWGGNPIGFTRPARTTRMFLDAQERGAKLVHVSNLFDCTSAKVDQWVPIKSGTDAALALGMAFVLIRDGLVDEDFMLRETSAAYLVRADGKYLREADVISGGREDWFVVIDKNTHEPAFVRRGEIRPYSYGKIEPQMEASLFVNGYSCKTAYTLLKEKVTKWAPALQEKVTGVPAAVCEQLAHEYAKSTPSLLAIGDGLRYSNGVQTVRALKLLSYLTGNYGLKGGSLMSAGIQNSSPLTDIDRSFINYPPELPNNLGDQVSLPNILKAFENPEGQQYKAWINAMGNPLLNWPNKDLWRNRILPNLELFVSIEIRMTDTCRWADYVLPEATIFERYEVVTDTDNCIVLNEPAIEPMGESRTIADIWRGIAEGVGIGQFFQNTQEEWVRATIAGGEAGKMISSDWASYVERDSSIMVPISKTEDPARVGELAPLTFERLKKAKALHMNVEDVPYDFYAHTPFSTVTGRLEFYNEMLAETGDQIADLQPTIIFDEAIKAKYPLQFFPARHKYFMQAQFTNVPEMEYLAYKQFGCALNPVTAAERGLKDGDIVEIYNDRGAMRSRLQLREEIAPGIAHTWYSFDETYYPDTDCPQVLATANNAPETETPMHKLFGPKFAQGFLDAGLPRTLVPIAGESTPETIWDTLCEVRKVEN